MSQPPPADAALEELARFREEWKREVEQKRIPPPQQGPHKAHTQKLQFFADYELPEDTNSGTATPQAGPSSETISGSPTAIAPSTSGHFNRSTVPPAVRNALSVYQRAVQHEQSGQLDEALLLYRQAFRMEPNVDRAYQTQEMLDSINAAQRQVLSSAKPGENLAGVEELATTLQRAVAITSGEGHGVIITTTLASLIEGFPQDLVFEPEDEERPIHLNILPEELLILIIRKLDHTSIERFAAVSRRARVLSLDPGIWRYVLFLFRGSLLLTCALIRELVVLSYKPPQVPSLESMAPVVAQYHSDFRRVYVEYPRVRLDGVYIAVCPGFS